MCNHTAGFADNRTFKFGKLCVCTGGRPKLIAHHPLVFGVRDTEVCADTPLVPARVRSLMVLRVTRFQSVAALRRKVGTARRVCVVGNGGIALEAVFGVRRFAFARLKPM